MTKEEYIKLVQELPEGVFEEYFDKYVKSQIEFVSKRSSAMEQCKKYAEDNKQYFELLKKEEVVIKTSSFGIELFFDIEELEDESGGISIYFEEDGLRGVYFSDGEQHQIYDFAEILNKYLENMQESVEFERERLSKYEERCHERMAKVKKVLDK